MKILFTLVGSGLLLLVIATSGSPVAAADSQKSALMEKEEDSVLRHIVLFKFTEDTSPEKAEAIVAAFEALEDKIPEVIGFEWGLNNSPEGLEKGFTHCFTLSFSSEAGRAIYLPHPDHKAFVEFAGPSIADVLVVDYWTP